MSTCRTLSGQCMLYLLVDVHPYMEHVLIRVDRCSVTGFKFRNVTEADIQSLERRLIQTMDMILSKKKRY